MDDQTNASDSTGPVRDDFDKATAPTASGKKTLSPTEGKINGEIADYSNQNTDEEDCKITKQENCKKKVSDLNGVCSTVRISEFERSNQSNVNGVKSITTEQEQVDEAAETKAEETCTTTIEYVGYDNEGQMESIMALITKDLSEPYSVYTYRYFIHNWPKLCFLVSTLFLCIICQFKIQG